MKEKSKRRRHAAGGSSPGGAVVDRPNDNQPPEEHLQSPTAVAAEALSKGVPPTSVVQADELWVKVVGSKLWLAHAIALPSRLWLAAEISAHRDRYLVRALADQVRRCARSLRVLVCTDGLKS